MPAVMPFAEARPASQAAPARPDGFYATGFKRFFDLVVAIALFIVLLPVIVATAVAVRLAMGSPVLFFDRRSGRSGIPFTLVKFRSMSPAVDRAGRRLADSERLTPFGRFLRRTSLDELPQLFNVIVGDMSLVGPRPLPERYLDRYSDREASRLFVRPGLTGWAQIHGRNEVDWPARLEMDARYVGMLGRWYGPLVDLWIGLCTVVQILVQALTGRGASAPGEATMREFQKSQ